MKEGRTDSLPSQADFSLSEDVSQTAGRKSSKLCVLVYLFGTLPCFFEIKREQMGQNLEAWFLRMTHQIGGFSRTY